MLNKTQAEGLLNALRDIHECDVDCTPRCMLLDLEPTLPADRRIIEAMSSVAA